MPPESRIRQTAYKCWIKELINGKYIIEEGWNPNYVLTQTNRKLSRVNLIATTTNIYINEERTYATLTLDDGSSTILLKTFKEDLNLLDNIEIGNTVLIIGRPREQNNEIFIIPEIIKKLNDPLWLKVRKLELKRITPETISIKPDKTEFIKKPQLKEEPFEIIEEEVVEETTETTRQRILTLIEKFDTEKGVDISKIIKESGVEEETAEQTIKELIKEGEIFESSKGKIKIV